MGQSMDFVFEVDALTGHGVDSLPEVPYLSFVVLSSQTTDTYTVSSPSLNIPIP